MTIDEAPSERRLRLVDRYAYNGFALLTLTDGWRFFEPAGIDGFIAYELHRGTALACGDPVCAEDRLGDLIMAFVAYCAAQRWRFAFVAASARVGKIAAALGYQAVKIGEEPFLDLHRPSFRGNAGKKARSAINHARKMRVEVEEYTHASPAIDAELEALAQAWLEARRAPPMAFILRSRLLAARERKRIFYAGYQGRIVAAVTCAPSPARRMLYVEELVRLPGAPYGASELLIAFAQQTAAREGWALFGLGLAPLHGATRQPYGRFRLLRSFIAVLYNKGDYVYGFRSLNHFKKKFAPAFWEDSFFIYQRRLLPVGLAVVAALAGGGGIPSLVLPRHVQWLRRVPSAALYSTALGGIAAAGLAAWELSIMRLPLEGVVDGASLAAFGAGLLRGAAGATLLAHRAISSVALALAGAWMVWRRRARA